ncbi:MAG: hypothetical protein AB7G39_06735 [Alphaproteobacteria bacterium]
MFAAPAQAQDGVTRNLDQFQDLDRSGVKTFDPITRATLDDALQLVRLSAYAIRDLDEQGEALNGLIDGFLQQGDLRAAMAEMNVVATPLWRGRGFVKIARYEQSKDRKESALQTYQKALAEMLGKGRSPEFDRTYTEISAAQTELGAYAVATETAKVIEDPMEEAQALVAVARAQIASKDPAAQTAGRNALNDVVARLKGAKTDAAPTVDMLIRIATLQNQIHDTAGTSRTLSAARTRISLSTYPEHDADLARVAAQEIEAGNPSQAMQMIRDIADHSRRARALAATAGTMAVRGDLDSALPLFDQALVESQSVPDGPARYDTVEAILVEQTRAGRRADAFRAAGRIKEKRAQSKALLAMGRILMEQNLYDEAIKLVDYISDPGMRAQIFVAVATEQGRKGKAMDASALLTRALEPTSTPADPDALVVGLEAVVQAQTAFGAPEARDSVYGRTQTIAEASLDMPKRVRVLASIARARAILKDKEEADHAVAQAYRLAWLDRSSPDFPDAMVSIVEAQIASGEFLEAFDTAARIQASTPGSRSEGGPPRADAETVMKQAASAHDEALRLVAVASAGNGDGRLALRAVQRIGDAKARAAALSAVAVAVAREGRPQEIARPGPEASPTPAPALAPATPPSAPAPAPAEPAISPQPAPSAAPSADAPPAPAPEGREPQGASPAPTTSPSPPAVAPTPAPEGAPPVATGAPRRLTPN